MTTEQQTMIIRMCKNTIIKNSKQYHGAIGDQTNEGMRRQQAQTDDQRILEGLEVILVHAGIDDVQKDGWDLSTPRECVLNGRVLGQQLCWKVGIGDVAVVRRELVTMQTEWANP